MSDSPIDLSRFSGHTPGPWSWWDSCSFRRLSHEGDGDVLAPVVQRSDGHPDVHFRNGGYTGPDARLIAAAPDLLAEIERLRAEVELRLSELDAAWMREKTLSGRAERAESALAALRKRVDEVRPLFNRYDKRLESPAAGFTGAIAVRVEDYDALRRLVETEG